MLRTPEGSLVGHIARAKYMHRVIENGQDVLVIFRGLDAYVSPNSYPTKPLHHRHVPTWNYHVVHMHGSIAFQFDDQAKRAAVGLLTHAQKPRLNGNTAWRMADAPPDYIQGMLDKIVAFRISVTRTLAKSKLCQDDEGSGCLGVIAGLRGTHHNAMAICIETRLQDAANGS
ncbi:FMN-binding negative transcriptional regulator [Stappia sp. ES.058]|uniref:FMN-binding negative transcriptional regulator n=1 Tax=Stappia sp. ES.058 TaxID=1881061 RepID=UPI001FCD9021|nr:FMN-binding negative transcriptional regulator [Stappia sp. ES.058]